MRILRHFDQGVGHRPSLNMLLCGVLAVFLVSCGGGDAGPIPVDADRGYCPVCKMRVRAGDPWTSELIYADRTKLVFESLGDLLMFYKSPQEYEVPESHRDLTRVIRISGKDYSTLEPIDIRNATLVYKSKVHGPMGPDFFAFRSEDVANQFSESNGGETVGFAEVTLDMVRTLRD